MSEPSAPDNRCRILRGVMGSEFVSELLAFAVGHESDFKPAGVYNKIDGARVDTRKRDGMLLYELGELRSPFERMIKERVPPVAAALGVGTDAALRELELCAYGDGGAFAMHADPTAKSARKVTCVYYFSATPRPFTGGQLRLHPWPVPLAATRQGTLDVEPECDSMVVLPSILPHEVLPVRCPTGAWRDRRFSLTCWLWENRRPGSSSARG
jgi:hypothetical protein